MTQASVLGAAELAATTVAFRDLLRSHQAVLNRLNVYPVPDGDTGTNMALTLESVVEELDHLAPDERADMGQVCKAIAHGSLMGARGNSGVILSQLLRGVAEELGAGPEAGAGGSELAAALTRAADLAYKAVVRPVEGTILTVARAAGEGAQAAAAAGQGAAGVAAGAKEAAAAALARTPELLEVLQRAGVVDAGGSGYVLLFDALAHVLADVPLPLPALSADAAVPGTGSHSGDGSHSGNGSHQTPRVEELRFEVMYLLDAPDDTIAGFRSAWADIGDSIVVVGGEGLWNCHIHTDDIGAAIEAAIDIGRPHRIRVTDLAEQVEEEHWVRDADPGSSAGQGTGTGTGTTGGSGAARPDEASAVTAVVAVVAGEGLGRIFRSLGVQRLVQGGQSMNPSTAQLLEAVESLPAGAVVLLPNNRNIVPVAQQIDALTDKAVRVVPTGSIVEGFAALLSYDPGAAGDENAAAMAASAGRVTPAAVTRAVRDAETEAGPVHEGDWIGISRSGVVNVADSPATATLHLLDTLLDAGTELVTVIEGEGSTPAGTRRITEWLAEEHPEVATEVHHGGQPLYPYLLGIE